MIIEVTSAATGGVLAMKGHRYVCALGRGGIVTGKREGDGGTPAGTWPLREVRFRADRLPPPETGLPIYAIAPDDGWCDAPQDPAYNRPVTLPHQASAEHMWRDDHLYDVVVVLGYNDAPVVPGAGSAIFFHLAEERQGRLAATEGCVAVTLADMQNILAACGPDTAMRIV